MRLTATLTIISVAILVFGTAQRVEAEAQSSVTPPEPQITFHKNAQGVRGVKLRVYLKTDPAVAWEVVTNPLKAVKLFKYMTAITESSKGRQYRDYHFSSMVGDKLITCRVTRNDAQRRLRWQRVEGHLVELMGSYHITTEEEYPGYTRLEYVSFIDPGGIGRVLMTDRGRERELHFMVDQLRRLTER